MDYSNLAKELRSLISGEVVIDEKNLAVYSEDASIFKVKPGLIVLPKDTEDIKKLVQLVSREKNTNSDLSITARSGGTDMSGGPLNDSIILDLTAHLNHINSINGREATTEPGVYYRDFEKATLAQGLLLPSYPASREICTVGGMVANNSGGEKSLTYGKTENYVEELNVVLSDGEEYIINALDPYQLEQKKKMDNFEGQVYREFHDLLEQNYDLIQSSKPKVSKNSAGYALWNVWDRNRFDLNRLFVGSQGTLGLVTKIKFKLIQPNKYSKLLVIFLKDLKVLAELINAVMKFKPESFESFDDHTFKLAIKLLPGLIKKMKGNFLSLAFKLLPDFYIILTNGMPRLVLIAEFTGNSEDEILKRIKDLQKQINSQFNVRTRIASDPADVKKYWTIRRESFNLLRKHIKDKQTAPFIDDIIVKPAQLPEFLPRLNEILDQYNSLTYTIAGHPGDANFHIIPLMDLKDETSHKIIPELSEKVYNLVLEFGGSITAEHNDGLIRTPYLERMYGPEIYRLFEKTKQIFDPLNIFNPGKKVGGDMDYAMSHIKQD